MTTVPPPVADHPAVGLPGAQARTLDNGVRVVWIASGDLPLVSLRVVSAAGSAYEPPERAGLSHLTGALLPEGTERLDADALNAELDRLGIALDVRAARDVHETSVACLASELDAAFDLTAEVLRTPRFPTDQLVRLRQEVVEELASRGDDAATVADDCTTRGLFGARHPYGRIVQGEAAAVRGIDVDEIRRFHDAHTGPPDLTVVVCGPMDPEYAYDRAERALGDWRPRAGGTPPILPEEEGEGDQRVERSDSAQAEIRIAAPAPRRTEPDWIPCLVANHLLGGSSITGRLGRMLREERGWTYHAASTLSAGRWGGIWSAECAVEPGVADDAVREIEHQMARLASEPATGRELDDAKRAIVLSLPRAFEAPASRTARFATLAAHGLPMDYWTKLPARVARVRAEEVRDAAARYLTPERLVRVVVGA